MESNPLSSAGPSSISLVKPRSRVSVKVTDAQDGEDDWAVMGHSGGGSAAAAAAAAAAVHGVRQRRAVAKLVLALTAVAAVGMGAVFLLSGGGGAAGDAVQMSVRTRVLLTPEIGANASVATLRAGVLAGLTGGSGGGNSSASDSGGGGGGSGGSGGAGSATQVDVRVQQLASVALAYDSAVVGLAQLSAAMGVVACAGTDYADPSACGVRVVGGAAALLGGGGGQRRLAALQRARYEVDRSLPDGATAYGPPLVTRALLCAVMGVGTSAMQAVQPAPSVLSVTVVVRQVLVARTAAAAGEGAKGAVLGALGAALGIDASGLAAELDVAALVPTPAPSPAAQGRPWGERCGPALSQQPPGFPLALAAGASVALPRSTAAHTRLVLLRVSSADDCSTVAVAQLQGAGASGDGAAPTEGWRVLPGAAREDDPRPACAAGRGMRCSVRIAAAQSGLYQVVSEAAAAQVPLWEGCAAGAAGGLTAAEIAAQPDGFPFTVWSGKVVAAPAAVAAAAAAGSGGGAELARALLPRSAPGTLLVLKRVGACGEAVAVARSYGGFAWEAGLGSTVVMPTCGGGGGGGASPTACTIGVQAGRYGEYRIDALQRPRASSHADTVVRLMQQGTFGAPAADVAAYLNASGVDGGAPSDEDGGGAGSAARAAAAWVRAQMALPASLMRARFRERTSPLTPDNAYYGNVRGVCALGSRWHRGALALPDSGKMVVATPDPLANVVRLSIDGEAIGEVPSWCGTLPVGSNSSSWFICSSISVSTDVGSRLLLGTKEAGAAGCARRPAAGTYCYDYNPAIAFASPRASEARIFDAGQVVLARVVTNTGHVVLKSLSTPCTGAATVMGVRGAGGAILYYRHEKHIVFLGNTVESPAIVDPNAGGKCPAVAKTRLNEGSCVAREAGACAAPKFAAGTLVDLNHTTLQLMHTADAKYVYRIRGLRLDGGAAPCKSGSLSRWIRTHAGNCNAAALAPMAGGTGATVAAALTAHLLGGTARKEAGGVPSDVQDLVVADFAEARGLQCNATASTVGASVGVGGNCWQHSHQHEQNVYDFSWWAFQTGTPGGQGAHPGNLGNTLKFKLRNPIKAFAERGMSEIMFPSHHPMDNWYSSASDTSRGRAIGVFGAQVDFVSLPTNLQSAHMGTALGVPRADSSSSLGFEACGSRGEVAGKPEYGNLYNGLSRSYPQGVRYGYYHWDGISSRVWTSSVLAAPDQLRQRVAWALAQVFTVPNLGKTKMAERYAKYYDIFVHHAFGQYRDILYEVSTSPLMGKYLTFRGNRRLVGSSYPDENYARELMQLFTIGLHELHANGTKRIDPVTGQPIATYTNVDIVAFARIWTGWNLRAFRSNLETESSTGKDENFIDPMDLHAQHRDPFPKTKLQGGFLGDGYPLCAELPPRAYLLRGAKYEKTGANSLLMGTKFDNLAGDTNETVRPHFAPSLRSSQLYAALCAADGGGRCAFPAAVVLDAPLACSGPVECGADTLRSVKVVDGARVAFYKYVEPPCTRLAFFEQGRFVAQGSNRQCADASVVGSAGISCCQDTMEPFVGDTQVTRSGDIAVWPYRMLPVAAHMGQGSRKTASGDAWSAASACADGQLSTWCRSGLGSTYPWLRFDYGVRVQFSRLTITNRFWGRWKSAWQKFVIEHSDDGTSFTVCHTGDANGAATHAVKCEGAGRYLRVRSLENTELRLHEVEVYGGVLLPPDEALPPNATLRAVQRPLLFSANTSRTAANDGQCLYVAEPVAFATAQARCAALVPNGVICAGKEHLADTAWPPTSEDWLSTCSGYQYDWVDASCAQQVQVHPGGEVSMIETTSHRADLRLDSGNVFAVEWQQVPGQPALFPRAAMNCSGCKVIKTRKGSCQCEVTVETTARFPDASAPLPTEAALRAALPIGASPPATFGSGVYTRCTTAACTATVGVAVHTRGGSSAPAALGSDAIFELLGTPPGGYAKRARYLLNRRSTVRGATFQFRNAPQFLPNLGDSPRSPSSDPYGAPNRNQQQAQYETDALLDMLLHHDSTPPFVARQLIQRLVTSNPSPRYVEAVATAFATGAYGGATFSGQRGDMGAAVAAIMLDREARSSAVELDAAHGRLQEPLLQVLSLMRTLGYRTSSGTPGAETSLFGIHAKIGQEFARTPDVFGFYSPFFSPSRPMREMGLVAPEAQLLTTPWVLGLANGLTSLVEEGLSAQARGNFAVMSTRGALHFVPASWKQINLTNAETPLVGNGSLHACEAGCTTDAHCAMGLRCRKLAFTMPAATLECRNAACRGQVTTCGCSWVGTNRCTGPPPPLRRQLLSACCRDCCCNAAYEATGAHSVPGCRHGASGFANVPYGGFCYDPDHAAPVVRELATLLTASRLHEGSQALIEKEYRRVTDAGGQAGGQAAALKHAMKLFLATPEIRVTNLAPPTATPRAPPAPTPSQGRGYKAVVLVNLPGGADSFQMLQPHSGCEIRSQPGPNVSHDLHTELQGMRPAWSHGKSDLLQISVPAGTQPCDTFGMHPSMKNAKAMYETGDALWIANMGR
jgi:uncharacterized protein (DUF1800 family)